jgi:hypothetical protein
VKLGDALFPELFPVLRVGVLCKGDLENCCRFVWNAGKFHPLFVLIMDLTKPHDAQAVDEDALLDIVSDAVFVLCRPYYQVGAEMIIFPVQEDYFDY